MAYTVLITGANRGIGLEFVRQYSAEGWKVLATCRNPKVAKELQALKNQNAEIEILKLDVSDDENIDAFKKALGKTAIDLLINNAGIISATKDERIDTLSKVTRLELLNVFDTNAFSPLLLTKALIPNLRAGSLKTVANISSSAGSITESLSGQWNLYSYKGSKAALNMLMVCLTTEEIYNDLRILLLHPGWVKTEMGGPGAVIDPEDSVTSMRNIIADTRVKSGMYIDYQGNNLPW